jgi:hypothetical protein
VHVGGRSLTRFDALTGQTAPYPARMEKGRLVFSVELPPSGSLLLTASNTGRPLAPEPAAAPAGRAVEPAEPLAVKRAAANVLRLDYCDLKLGDAVEEDLWFSQAADKAFQKHGFRGNPWGGTQFKSEWIDKDRFPPESGFEASFHFDVEGGVSAQGVEAVIERPRFWQVSVNGSTVKPRAGAWWLDTSFGVYDIAAYVRPGRNTIALKAQPMSVHAEIQPVYIRGDFGVAAQEEGFRIVPPRELSLGAWKDQQLPFYSDSLIYRRSFELKRTSAAYKVRLGEWAGTVAEVKVNGVPAGIIGWKPYELDVTKLVRAGKNDIEVSVYGSLKNLLGPHLMKYKPGLVGSWLWRTAPQHTPPGSQYDLLGYGLFSEFQLVESGGRN